MGGHVSSSPAQHTKQHDAALQFHFSITNHKLFQFMLVLICNILNKTRLQTLAQSPLLLFNNSILLLRGDEIMMRGLVITDMIMMKLYLQLD